VKQWKKDTEVHSSIARMIKHPAYQQIIDMGEAVIPLLLAELEREPDFWFAALQKLTGVGPSRQRIWYRAEPVQVKVAAHEVTASGLAVDYPLWVRK
jgi:hypothetical protein